MMFGNRLAIETSPVALGSLGELEDHGVGKARAAGLSRMKSESETLRSSTARR